MVLVEVARKAYLASLVPVIVNAILNEHQIVADIVAFVNKGDFPRSRLGEKQRGKILGSWVSSKMRTMAQFGIRDADGGISELTEVVEQRQSAPTSLRNSSVVANSLRNIEPAPKIIEQRELEKQHEAGSLFSPTKTGESTAQPYNDSIVDSTTLGGGSIHRSDDTPTEPNSNNFESPTTPGIILTDENTNIPTLSTQAQNHQTTFMDDYKAPDVPPPVGPKPSSMAPQLPALPAVDGREGDLWTLPSQRRYGDFKLQHPAGEGDDWPQEALMHMNLAHR